MKRAGVSLRVILLTVFICIAIPISVSGSDKLIIKDMDGATTFKVEDDGAISAVGKLLAGVEADVAAGKMTPSAAASRLMAAFRGE